MESEALAPFVWVLLFAIPITVVMCVTMASHLANDDLE
jgi:hypothetical protein